MVAAQGGDPAVIDDPGLLPRARHVEVVGAPQAGTVAAVDAEAIGRAAVLLGAGRARVGDRVDHAAGIRLAVGPGDRVAKGAPLLELHHNGPAGLADARNLAAEAIAFGSRRPGRAGPGVGPP